MREHQRLGRAVVRRGERAAAVGPREAASASRGAAAGRSVPTAGWDIGVGHGWPIAGGAAGAKDLRRVRPGSAGALSRFSTLPEKALCCQRRGM